MTFHETVVCKLQLNLVDIGTQSRNVRLVPKADIGHHREVRSLADRLAKVAELFRKP